MKKGIKIADMRILTFIMPEFIILLDFKNEGNFLEGFFDFPQPPCFINRSQVCFLEGKNILEILVTY